MRLLNTQSLRLELFIDSFVPQYAILSHTWGDEEIMFDDIRDPGQPLPLSKRGFEKVKGSCFQASQDGYQYIWIDTCCIDKSSSAELSEAINSMFMWYHNAGRCYAYLADFDSSHSAEPEAGFERSRWFTRGWTLQELIAPRDVCFYDCNWSFVGRRQASPSKPTDDSENSNERNEISYGYDSYNNDGGDDGDDDDDGNDGSDGENNEDGKNNEDGDSNENSLPTGNDNTEQNEGNDDVVNNNDYNNNDDNISDDNINLDNINQDNIDLADRISSETGIHIDILRWYVGQQGEFPLEDPSAQFTTLKSTPEEALVRALGYCSVAQKMSWAARRQTTRPEDEAYSLLGLFGVNMPLLYGEGRQAFFRLQQEILRFSNDQSILAFSHPENTSIMRSGLERRCPLLAVSPACFADSGEIELPEINAPVWPGASQGSQLTELSASQKVLETRLCLYPATRKKGKGYWGILDCVYQDDCTSHPAIFLEALDEKEGTFTRLDGHRLIPFRPSFLRSSFKAESVMDADFSSAFSATVRLYFDPPKQGRRQHTDSNALDLFVPGMKITRLDSRQDKPRASTDVFAAGVTPGCYPQSVIGSAPAYEFYVPSMNIKPWFENQAQRDEGASVPEPSAAFPFGAIILQLTEFLKGTAWYRREVLQTTHLVLSWGQSHVKNATAPWLAVLDWAKVAEACGLDQDPGPDLNAAAQLTFEKQRAWMPLVNTLPALIVEHDSLLGKVRFDIAQLDFFGRPVLDVGMTIDLKSNDTTQP